MSIGSFQFLLHSNAHSECMGFPCTSTTVYSGRWRNSDVITAQQSPLSHVILVACDWLLGDWSIIECWCCAHWFSSCAIGRWTLVKTFTFNPFGPKSYLNFNLNLKSYPHGVSQSRHGAPNLVDSVSRVNTTDAQTDRRMGRVTAIHWLSGMWSCLLDTNRLMSLDDQRSRVAAFS